MIENNTPKSLETPNSADSTHTETVNNEIQSQDMIENNQDLDKQQNLEKQKDEQKDQQDADKRENQPDFTVAITTPTNSPAQTDNANDTEIFQQIATALNITEAQVSATVAMLDDGATVPFIARYRKDKTKGLDDVQLRELEKKLAYLRDMFTRRGKILDMLTQQGKLTDALKARIDKAQSKLELEDIYLPYRPRRTSKAHKAREVGLADLASKVLAEEVVPEEVLTGFAPQGELAERYTETPAQLEAMQYIIMETWSEDLVLLDDLRIGFGKIASIHSQLANEQKREVGQKFSDYFDHTESMAKLPAHRLLAMLRGRQENVLMLKVTLKEQEDNIFIEKISKNFQLDDITPQARQVYLKDTAKKLWLEKYRPHIEHRLLTEKRLNAEADAIDVFGENLRHLLMAAPAGGKVTLGVDPGIRHGVKLAVVDATGHLIENAHGVVYPFAPDNKRDEALAKLEKLITTHAVEIIAIGNGTASRETDALIAELKDKLNSQTENVLKLQTVVVNEAGASVYSASELASQELKDVDVSIRGAVSIARRLQDPLSELVKVDPKAIGVGQYQHDVNQNNLSAKLTAVTQDCVNAVGVDVNTASPAILTHIAGLNSNVAQQIYNYRCEHGAFATRKDLKAVPRLGERTFEQSAGFLRIRNASNKIEQTGVHPESYALVEQILAKAEKTLEDVLGKADALTGISANDFANENFGVEAVRAVIQELAKPAHDPRPAFKTASFMDGINEISDLHEGMELEGVITNVTHFGAFVDVGVHQDGLVHISELANRFVADPLNLVKVGQIVTVRVLSADADRKRISFSMKTPAEKTVRQQPRFQHKSNENKGQTRREDKRHSHQNKPQNNQNKHKDKNSKGRTQNQSYKNKTKQAPAKVGTLGALLAEAGLKKSGK